MIPIEEVNVQAKKKSANLPELTLIARLKNRFLAWSQTVTYHCFPKIFKEQTHLAGKYIWALIFLAFSCLTCYILVNNILQFYQYNVSTSIRIINESPTPFPAVAICDVNPFTSQYAQFLVQQKTLDAFGLDIVNLSGTEYELVVVNKVAKIVKSFAANSGFGDENRKRLGADLINSVRPCFFNDILCDSVNDFRWFYHFNYGNCLLFNSGVNASGHIVPLKQSPTAGSQYGLRFRVGPLVNSNNYTTVLPRGLMIYVGNQSFSPRYDDDFTAAEAGKESNIVIERTFTSQTPAPYSECDGRSGSRDPDLSRSLSGSVYRQVDCVDLCMQQAVQRRCKCYFTALTPIYNTSACLNLTQVECVGEILLEVHDVSSVLYRECALKCPLECDMVSYGLKISTLIFPNEEVYNILKNDIVRYSHPVDVDISTYDSFRQYFYSINIFYPTATYTYIAETPQVNTFGLLSSLGGSLGMFLGFSVFSLLEVFELLLSLASTICKKRVEAK